MRSKALRQLIEAPVTLDQLHTAHVLFDSLTATTATFDRQWVLHWLGNELEERYGRHKGMNVLARFLGALRFLQQHWAELSADNFIVTEGIRASLLQSLAESPLDEPYLEDTRWRKRLSYGTVIERAKEIEQAEGEESQREVIGSIPFGRT